MTLVQLVISALFVPLECRSVGQMENVCRWATTVTALRALTASLISIAIWENVLISKRLMTSASTETNAGDRRPVSLITPAQLQEFAQNT